MLNKRIAGEIIKESKKQSSNAQKYIYKNITNIFPEISKSLQTERAAIFILKNQHEFLKNLEEMGEIDEKDIEHIFEMIDRTMYKIKYSAPDIVNKTKKHEF